ncbi:MAG: helix-turn-helix domain-containing protein [Azonexaceae bacterium]|nr:helix-turn-helix domain-containing protein [Azonexaceae bacterium]
MPSELIYNPKQNRILGALATNDYSRLQDDLDLIHLELGQVLYESGDTFGYIYFPITCIVSLIFTTKKGGTAELAITGNDGLVGIPLVLGGDTTTHQVVVQSAGVAYRLKVEVVRWELDQGGELQHLALRYTQALMTQMAQSIVCNRFHAVEQQLCRWLLFSLDLLPGNQLNMTQELIANMLGVRREAITEAAGKLQAAGLIEYSRGHITVLDRPGLEERSCECYAAVRSEYDRIFRLKSDVRGPSRPRPNPANVRHRAEARLLQSPHPEPKTAWDNAQLVHELQVHQIELEMSNEELRHAYEESDNLRERYADIYDFAPVGYLTLDALGVIIDMNLAGAVLLGAKGSQKGRHRFAAFLESNHADKFNHFVDEVINSKKKLHCESVLAANAHRPATNIRIEAVPDADARECRMVVIDTSGNATSTRHLSRRITDSKVIEE